MKFYCVNSDEYEIGEAWFTSKIAAIASAKEVDAAEVDLCDVGTPTKERVLAILNQRSYVVSRTTVWKRDSPLTRTVLGRDGG